MSGVRSNRWVIGGGVTALVVVALPLWGEFHEPNNIVWNGFLAIFLIGLIVGAFLLHRYFLTHAGEMGEARFDTTNKQDNNG